MAIPDITGLTEEELVTLLQQANAELHARQNSEQTVRETLLNPTTVRTQIDNLLTQKDNVQAVIDTPTVRSRPTRSSTSWPWPAHRSGRSTTSSAC